MSTRNDPAEAAANTQALRHANRLASDMGETLTVYIGGGRIDWYLDEVLGDVGIITGLGGDYHEVPLSRLRLTPRSLARLLAGVDVRPVSA
jgi:hypothetical protein